MSRPGTIHAIAQHAVFKFLDDAGYYTIKLHDCYPLPIAFREKGAKEGTKYIRGQIHGCVTLAEVIGNGRDIDFYVRIHLDEYEGKHAHPTLKVANAVSQ